MVKTVSFISLGCPKNLVDTEVMMGLLENEGYKIVNDPREADILVVNTCSFIEDAKVESIDVIMEMAGFKKEKGDVKLVVTGCLPQMYTSKIKDLFPEADLFIGTGEYYRICDLLDRLLKNDGRIEEDNVIVGVPEYIHSSKTPRKVSTPPHIGYLKISEGCSHKCSFCVIPKLRGRYRSRPLKDIIEEGSRLVGAGARELNLVAQDTTSYGKDLKDGSNLARLIQELSTIDDDIWIRIFYTHPAYFTDELIDAIASLDNVCKYVDIPIQHVNDRILKLMGRKENGVQIKRLIKKIKAKIPTVTLRTSLIVGFPSETAGEFDELKRFVEDVQFDRLGIFSYSREEGTSAFKMGRQVPAGIKKEREEELFDIQRKISLRKNKSMVGKRVRALLDGKSEETELLWVARTEGQAPDIDGVTYINDISETSELAPYRGIKFGDFVTVEITDAYDYDLVGRITGRT